MNVQEFTQPYKRKCGLLRYEKFNLHNKNKEERLTKMWNQSVPIPGNGAKIWSGENRAQKEYILKSRFKVCARLASSILSL